MSRKRWVPLVLVLAAAATAGVVVFGGTGRGDGKGGGVHAADPAPEAPPTPAEDPPPPPTLASSVGAIDLVKKRAFERFQTAWEEILALWRSGKAREALAALNAIRERDAPFLALPSFAPTVGRIEASVKGLDRAAELEASLAKAKMPDAKRASLDGRLAATAEVLARTTNDADLDQLTRHLKRFLLEDASLATSKDPTDAVLRTFIKDRRARRANDKNPAVADADAAEERRVDQLEKLRQREAVGLLDAIHAGLAWLALHQRDDGASCDQATLDRCKALEHKTSCLADQRGTGDSYALGATALAAIAFLDFRDQDVHGWFDPYLGRALEWLLKQQKPDGSFQGGSTMYSGAMALMAFGQAAVSTGDPRWKEAVRKGIGWYAGAMSPLGGWRYKANDIEGDLSVTAWVGQACEAAKACGVPIPIPIEAGLPIFLRYVHVGDHRFRYRPHDPGERPTLIPAGMLLSRIANPNLDPAVTDEWKKFLQGLPANRRPDLYTTYYGVRVSILLSGSLDGPWRTWVFDLAKSQIRGTTAAGSYPPKLWNWASGPTVVTAMATLTLEHALYLR